MKAARAHEELKAEQRATSASPQDERKEARDRLTLMLSFFSRVDAKTSALLPAVARSGPLVDAFPDFLHRPG